MRLRERSCGTKAKPRDETKTQCYVCFTAPAHVRQRLKAKPEAAKPRKPPRCVADKEFNKLKHYCDCRKQEHVQRHHQHPSQDPARADPHTARGMPAPRQSHSVPQPFQALEELIYIKKVRSEDRNKKPVATRRPRTGDSLALSAEKFRQGECTTRQNLRAPRGTQTVVSPGQWQTSLLRLHQILPPPRCVPLPEKPLPSSRRDPVPSAPPDPYPGASSPFQALSQLKIKVWVDSRPSETPRTPRKFRKLKLV